MKRMIFIAWLFYPAMALAYVGPGPGLTMLSSLWALIAGIAFALFMVIFYPIRLLMKKRAAKRKSTPDA